RTASEAAASTTAVRVVSSSHGSWETVNAVNGSTAWVSTPGTVYSAPGGAAPETGSQRKPTATPATSASETTNGGTAANTTAKVLLSRSSNPPRRIPAAHPTSTARTAAVISAAAESPRVNGIRSASTVVTGRPWVLDQPRSPCITPLSHCHQACHHGCPVW